MSKNGNDHEIASTTKKQKMHIVVLLIILLAGSCSTLNRFVSDFERTFLSPHQDEQSQAGTPLSSDRPPLGSATNNQVAFSAWNRPDNARDIAIYRTGKPLPLATTLSRSKPPSSIKSEFDLKVLVDELKKADADPFLQVKAIHDWIALTITYDAPAFLNNLLTDQSWQAVLRTGKAVCDGYANVADQMLKIAGFRTVKVNGYARGAGTSNLVEENPVDSNHAWNLVQIHDYWYLLDCTWDSGYLDGRITRKKYSTAYFLIKPEWMIYSHFPSRPEWQLLDPPLSARQFSLLPDLKGDFFEAIRSGYESLRLQTSIESPHSFDLEAHDGYQLTAALYDSSTGREDPSVFVQQAGSNFTVYLAPPKGLWILRLFSGLTNETKFGSIGELVIESNNTEQVSIPTIFGDFRLHNGRIIEPMFQAIRIKTAVKFEVYVENVYSVLLIINGKEHEMLSSGNGIYTLTLEVPDTKKVDIFVQKTRTSNRRNGLLSFPVIP